MRALHALARAYRDRGAAATSWKRHGGRVVGYLGADVPEELIIAAGMLPVRLWGDPDRSTQLAERLTGTDLDPVTRSQLDGLLTGAYSDLDYLVISHQIDGLARLFYVLRELQRVEPVPGLPPFHFFDLLHLPYRTSALYNRGRARLLRRVLEEWSGSIISDDDLRAAVALCNENRRLLQRVAALRTADPPRLTGVEALEVIGAGLTMPRVDHNRLLTALLDEASQLSAHRGVRIFVTGSAHDTTCFYELLESRGAVVVGEDHDWGNRSFECLVDETPDPLDGIVDRYHLGPPASARTSVAARAGYTAARASATAAEAVVCFIQAGDDAPAWDFALQRRALAERGIPVLLLAEQPYRLVPRPELVGRIDAFLGSIPTRSVRTS